MVFRFSIRQNMNTMLKSKLLVKNISKPVSELALGAAAYKLENKDLWFNMLDDFVSYGGTVIDTAHDYGDSEKVIGMWFEAREIRNKMVVITKCGHGKDYVLPAENFSGMVMQELTQSLEYLRTDYIDLYLLHRDNPLVPVEKIVDCMNMLLTKGFVRAYGVSNWEYSRVEKANEYAHKHGLKEIAVVSNNVSLAVPTCPFYKGLVSVGKVGELWHKRTGIPLISWSSQARGFFTGRYAERMSKNIGGIEDWFTKRMYEVYCTDENFKRLRRAKDLGEKKGGYSAVQVALSWVLHKPYPVVPIVGPHSKKNLISCIKATSLKLSESEIEWLSFEPENTFI